MCMCVYTNIHTYVRMYACTYVRTHVRTHQVKIFKYSMHASWKVVAKRAPI